MHTSIENARHAARWLRATTVARGRSGNERGASLVEYGLLLAFVFIAVFLTVQVFGESLVGLFDASSAVIDDAPNASGGS